MKKLGLNLAVGLMAAVLIAPAFADNGSTSAGNTDSSTATVPLQIVPVGKNYKVGITVSVAGGPPTLLTFDTGGVGLHIFASQVGNQNIRYTGQKIESSFGSAQTGFSFQGEIAYAPVTIGGITTQPIPILVIQNVHCRSGNSCGFDMSGNAPPMFGSFYGELGAGMRLEAHGKTKLYTPFRALPGNYGSGFIIENLNPNSGTGQLVLGLTPQNSAGFNKVQLPQEGVMPNGSAQAVYNDKGLMVNYSVGNVSQTWRTAFDTGGDANVNLFTGKLAGVPSARRNHMVRPGTPFEASLNNAFDWQFTTGREEGVNAVKMLPTIDNRPPYVNTGLLFFFNYNVMYDFNSGMLGFQQQS